ncbi:MAG TPA: MATE family efflux transporter [Candidatus Angelobacter sp.]|jgi:MATE family multidrug resistance protein|nr:MATE family efflux transporter [Candidatus Angelobacter sp.]
MLHTRDIGQEFRPMLRLAAPLALTELGWLAMSFTDTVMVGRLPDSATAIGAVSLGSTLFYTIGVFGSGVMLGMDTLVAQSYGARKLEECHRIMWNSLYLAGAIAPLLMLSVLSILPLFNRVGLEPALVAQTVPFLKALVWSTLPLALYFALRRYLQAMHIVKPVVFALISANLVNLLGNWVLVYGHLGARSHGVAGSGWSTCISRAYMVAVLAVAVVYYDRKRSSGLWSASRRLELRRIRQLLRLGLPAALQLLLEIGAFATATFLIGKLGAVQLAGHQIALNVASFTYMVPLGICSAAAVRVGHAMGARDAHAAARSGWMAIFFGALFMSCSGLALFLFARPIARMYTPESDVVNAGATLLLVAAVFQLFDGLQVVATGALRGAGNTRIPMFANFLGYWVIGLPLGAFLCFKLKMGAVGMWLGLCLALILIGSALLGVWHWVIKNLVVPQTIASGLEHASSK